MRFIMSFAALLFMVMPAQGSNDISKNSLRVEGDFSEYRPMAANKFGLRETRFCAVLPMDASRLLKNIDIFGLEMGNIYFAVHFKEGLNGLPMMEINQAMEPLMRSLSESRRAFYSREFLISDEKKIKDFFAHFIAYNLMTREDLDQILAIIKKPMVPKNGDWAKLFEADRVRIERQKERDRRQQEDERRLAQPKLVRDISDIWDAALGGLKATIWPPRAPV